MKYLLLVTATVFFIFSCKTSAVLPSNLVTNSEELRSALSEAKPGDDIVMANGKWENIQIKVTSSGTAGQAITLRAETPGQVLIQGESNLQLGGDYITVDGLYFTNGFSPTRSVLDFSVGDTVANYCIVRNCVIKEFNKLQRNFRDIWFC